MHNRFEHTDSNRFKDPKKQDSSAKDKHVTNWGRSSNKLEAAGAEKTQGSNAHPELVAVAHPGNELALGMPAQIANPGELQKRESLPNDKQGAESTAIVEPEQPRSGQKKIELKNKPERGIGGVTRPLLWKEVTPEEYNQHKQKIHENIKKAENYHKILNEIDQRLEKRFKNLSWFKSILGRDSIKKIDKCEYELKQNKQKLKNALDDLENTIQGNPNNYACVSPTQFIKLDRQDESQFQRRIDRMKPSEPQPGDKQTLRQKRFEEQEAVRTQKYKDDIINSTKEYKRLKSKKIYIFKGNIDKMMKEYKNQKREISNSSKLFQKSNNLSSEISGWKRKIENMQRNEVSNFPDLTKKCNDLKSKLNDIHKELDSSMKEKFGSKWTLRNVKDK